MKDEDRSINPPPKWTSTTLGALGNYWNGRGFKKSEWRPAGQGRAIIRIQDLTGTGSSPNYFDGLVDERNVARKGDLLVSWAATLGVYEWAGPEAVINQHIFKVESFVNPRWHRYLIESVLADLRRQSHGSGMVHVTRGVFDAIPVHLPPPEEQEQIVAAIEEHFSHLDAAEALLGRVKQGLRAFEEVVYRQALIPGPRQRLGDVVRTSSGGTPSRSRSDLFGGSIPWIKSGELGDKVVTITEESINDTAIRESSAKLVPEGTVLIAMYGATIGRLGRVGVPSAATNQAIAALYPTADINPDYLWNVLRALRKDLLRRGQGGAQPNISQSILRELAIPVPSPTDQERINIEVERGISIWRQLDRQIDLATLRSKALRRSVLAAAIAGELLAPDDKNGSASTPLEHTRSDRSGLSPRSMRRKAVS